MYSEEHSKKLWCPMARVGQAGHTDINVSYNRSLTKTHVPIKLNVVSGADEFELGQQAAEQRTEFVLSTVAATSLAARCLGSECMMWRWVDPEPANDGIDRTAEHQSRRGFCGIAGWPGK